MPGRVLHVNVSPGGVPKLPVPSARVDALGLEGDAVNHPKIHGGPERAVCLFAQEIIDALRAEGHPIRPGDVGENLTVEGLDWPSLEVGAVLAVGEALRLQLTQRVEPCRTIAGAFEGGRFKRIQPSRAPDETRWYARVLTPGIVAPGDPIRAEAPVGR